MRALLCLGHAQATKNRPDSALLWLKPGAVWSVLAHGLLAISLTWLQAGRPNHHVSARRELPRPGAWRQWLIRATADDPVRWSACRAPAGRRNMLGITCSKPLPTWRSVEARVTGNRRSTKRADAGATRLRVECPGTPCGKGTIQDDVHGSVAQSVRKRPQVERLEPAPPRCRPPHRRSAQPGAARADRSQGDLCRRTLASIPARCSRRAWTCGSGRSPIASARASCRARAAPSKASSRRCSRMSSI